MTTTRRRLTLLAILTFLVPLQSALGATFYVSNEAELKSAVLAGGDRTVILTNDIVVTTETQLVGPVTIDGNGYTISVPQPGLDAAGIVNPSASTIRVFTISDSSKVVLRNMTVIGGSFTGAISVGFTAKDVNLEGVTITRSTAPGPGGALWNQGGILRLVRCRLTGNASTNGGAFFNEGGTTIIEQSTFDQNRTLGVSPGGAINNGATLFINNSTLSNNVSTQCGGAIRNGGTLWAVNSTFTGNVSPDSASCGGAIGSTGQLNLINNDFAYNYVVDSATNPTTATLADVRVSSGAKFDAFYNIFHAVDPNTYWASQEPPPPLPTCFDEYLGDCAVDFAGLCSDSYVASVCKKTCGVCTAKGLWAGPEAYDASLDTNVFYTGAADGSDDSMFAGGVLRKVTGGDGAQVGTAQVYQPILTESSGVVTAPLKTNSFAALTANRGTKTGLRSDASVVGFLDKDGKTLQSSKTVAWVDLRGSGASGYEVAVDQRGSPRSNPTTRGATEGVLVDVYVLTVLPPAGLAADGSVSGGSAFGDSYLAGTTVILTAFPATGKSFSKWVDENGADVSTANPYTLTVNANTTLQPVFVSLPPGNYTITYLGNGNTGGTVPAPVTTSGSTTISGPGTMVRDGYDFVNWNTAPNGSGTSYAASATYSAGANLTLYAQWQRKPPTLTAVAPGSGPAGGGTTVSLTGTGFIAGMTVSVNGVANACRPVTLASATSASCVMPAGTGTVNVVAVTTAGSSSAQPFTYQPAPTLTAISPTTGATAGGYSITLTGTGFGSGMTVTVDGVANACKPVTISDQTSASCVMPNHSAGTVNVSVTTPSGTSGNQSFTYNDAPSLSGVSPDQGPTAGGTVITLTGTAFAAGMTVTVGGNPCTPMTLTSATEASCTTPAGAAGAANVIVTTGGGSSGAQTFTYDNVPTVKGVSPKQGPLAGGTTITVTGTSFVAGSTTVSVGGQACTSVTWISDKSVTCVTPAGTAGAAVVSVTTPGGPSVVNGTFTYDDVPTISAVSPSQGPLTGGTTITLTGTGFVAAQSSITVGGAPCSSVNVTSQTSATCVTPAGSAGVAEVRLTTPGGTSGPGYFTYDNTPNLKALSPLQGPTTGGTPLTLKGTSFLPGATVSVGGNPCASVVVLSDTDITCVTPGGTAGVKDVTVTTAGGTSAARHFTYDDVPTVSDVQPGQGPLAGGTTITLTGAAFVNGSTTVTVGGAACTGVVVSSSTSLTCTTPVGTAGVKDVTVTTPGGTSGPAHFTYDDLPVLSTITPDRGTTAGGNVVTLTGTGFVAPATVNVDGVVGACGPVNIATTTSLTCGMPARAAGAVTVTVTTPGGTSNGVAYQFDAAPALTSVTPGSAPSTGGTIVTLVGTGFVDGSTTVSVGGSACTSVSVASSTQLSCVVPALPGGGTTITATTPGGTSNALTFSYVAVVDGLCGAADGVATAFVPTTSLCSAGNPSAVIAGSPWTWSCDGLGGGTTSQCSAPNQTTATGTGLARVELQAGTWEIDTANSAGFIPTTGHPKSPPNTPPNWSFPEGLLDFTLINGAPGSTAVVKIHYPNKFPAGTVYWKYGPSPDGYNCSGAACASPHWYQMPAGQVVFKDKTITLFIADGGVGDDDLTPNGVIVDQGGPGVPGVAIPTLSEWAMILMSLLLVMVGVVQIRRMT